MKMRMAVLSLGVFVIGAPILPSQRIAASESFRPPVKSIAELTSQQRLSLAISAVNQQLVYGRIHDDYLTGLRASPLSGKKSITPPWATAVAPPRPSGEYAGMSEETPILRGQYALVPVRHNFREVLTGPPGERVATVPDTLVFVDDGAKWVLAPERLAGDSPVWDIARREAASGAATRLTHSAGTVSWVDFLSLFSDSLLLPRSIYTSADVLNSASSNRLFGTDILSVPSGVCASAYYSRTEGDHDFLGITDMSWSRLVGADGGENWIATAGSPGSGPLQFRMPMGICGTGHGYRIADAMNNRIVVVNIVINNGHAERLNDTSYQVAGFNYPTDVDARGAVPPEDCPYEVVADNGNGQIVQLGIAPLCSSVERIGTMGSGVGQFLNPTSVCYGRNSTDHKQNKDFYVADRGNHRVTRVYWLTYPTGHWAFQSFDMEENADIVAVDVDNFGQVYALDAGQGILYKFSSNLTPIAAYQFHTADGTTFYPHDFAVAHGIQWNDSAYKYLPVVLGDASITHNYTGSTGVHRYALGVWVLKESAAYVPRTIDPSPDYVRINHTLTDMAQVTIKVFQNGIVRWQSGPTARVSGPQPTAYWYPAAGDSSGNYLIEIRAASLYSNSDTAVIAIPITIDRSLVNHGPVVMSGPNLDCASCSCLVSSRFVGYSISVMAIDQDGDPLTYFWECDPVSIFDNELDSMTTAANRVTYYAYVNAPVTEGKVQDVSDLPPPYVRVTVQDDRGGALAMQETFFTKCPNGVDDGCCCCFNHGDLNEDLSIDVFDIVLEIDVIFGGGSVLPYWDCPVLRTDFNCDRATDVFDLIAMIDYAFSSGAGPCDPCAPAKGVASMSSNPARQTEPK